MAQSKLKKAVIFIPLTYNDGSSIPERILETIYDELFDAYQGWTIEGTVKGAYRMRSGEKRVEQLVRVSIVLDRRGRPNWSDGSPGGQRCSARKRYCLRSPIR